jgi:hypothetical protein
MGKWVLRTLLPIWLVGYLVSAHAATTLLLVCLGAFRGAVLTFAAALLWGIVFYFLLKREGSLSNLRVFVDRVEEGQRSRAFTLVKGILSRGIPLRPLLVFMSFLLLGAPAGVLAVVLSWNKGAIGDIVVVALGCFLSGFLMTLLVYGPLIVLIGRLLGGG